MASLYLGKWLVFLWNVFMSWIWWSRLILAINVLPERGISDSYNMFIQEFEIWISWRVSTKSYSWLVVSINVICDKYPQIKVWLMVAFDRNGVYYKVNVFAPDSDGKKKLLTVAELHDTLQQIFQWTEGTPLLCNYSSLQLDHCLSKPYLKELCS